MNDKYLQIFPDMFFDVEDNEAIKSILDEASDVLSVVVEKLGEVENELKYKEDIEEADSYVHLVIVLFIRKLMEQVDAINILYSKGSVTEAELVLRSMLETVASLKFILNEDGNDREETRFRASAYFIGRHYQELSLYDKLSKPGKSMSGKLGQEELDKLDKKRTAIRNMINRNKYFKRVDDERNKLKKPENSSWYEVAGAYSIRDLMTAVGMEKYYDGLYKPLSLETHALNVAMAMKIKDDEFIPFRIRSPHNGENTFVLTCLFATDTLEVLYKYLGDGNTERLEFAEFYKAFLVKRNKVEQDLKNIIA